MQIERLRLWIEAMRHAETSGRDFDMSVFRAGETTCAAGDLAMYGPANALGYRFCGPAWISNLPEFVGRRAGETVAGGLSRFLGVVRDSAHGKKDHKWVVSMIHPVCDDPKMTDEEQREFVRRITRADMIKRIEAKIAEIAAAATS
jgi:hypothetical protein